MRFSGTVGFTHQVTDAPGVVKDVMIERPYRGDVIVFSRRLEQAGGAYPTLNDDVLIGNSISIVGDAFASENFMSMRYVYWQGFNWKITNVDVRRPRLVLTLGGQWDGPTPN
jgi:hypothetical protein